MISLHLFVISIDCRSVWSAHDSCIPTDGVNAIVVAVLGLDFLSSLAHAVRILKIAINGDEYQTCLGAEGVQVGC